MVSTNGQSFKQLLESVWNLRNFEETAYLGWIFHFVIFLKISVFFGFEVCHEIWKFHIAPCSCLGDMTFHRKDCTWCVTSILNTTFFRLRLCNPIHEIFSICGVNCLLQTGKVSSSDLRPVWNWTNFKGNSVFGLKLSFCDHRFLDSQKIRLYSVFSENFCIFNIKLRPRTTKVSSCFLFFFRIAWCVLIACRGMKRTY